MSTRCAELLEVGRAGSRRRAFRPASRLTSRRGSPIVRDMARLKPLLASLFSLLLILPQGWCCQMGLRDCCHASSEKRDIDAHPTRTSCCCPSEAPASDECEHLSAPTSPHSNSCCCARPPVTPGESAPALSDAPVLMQVVPPDSGWAMASGFATTPHGVYATSPPPTNVLHCVWLC